VSDSNNISIVVPVFNPGETWHDWLEAVGSQSARFFTKVVIDSSSTDGCVGECTEYGFDVIVIPTDDFDHGTTRQLALKYVKESDVVVFLTQDAILSDSDSIRSLVKSFEDERVAIVYGRQLPRRNAAPIEAHARLFNYPDEGHVYGIEDKDLYGLKAAFNSNSFSAYRVSVLKKIGGFKAGIIFGEDMLVAANVLKSGYRVAYCHSACVYHSHDYSLKQEFQRYFDMGVMHEDQYWLLADFGKPTGEGFRFVKSELSYLLKHSPQYIPRAMFGVLMKYLGYRVGRLHKIFPLWIKRRLSMNKRYWFN